jgi:serine protease AprX
MSKITINGVTLDPLAQGPALAAANLHSADATDSDYILIQTTQPLSKDMKSELTNMGVVILEYVPDDTYLCYYPGTDLDQIRSLAYVAWANIYLQGFKVAPSLMTGPAAAPAGVRNLLEIAAAPASTLRTTPKVVDVVFHSNVDPQSIRDKLAAAAHLDPADLNLTRHKIRLSVEAQHLNDLASLDEVRHLEEVLPMKLHNNIARQLLNVEPPPILGRNFDGEGQVVAVADTGFDKGSTTDVHNAFTGRVVRLYALGRPNNANDPNGHGTHVAGSVLGDGNSTMLGHAVRGTAPAARLVLQSVLDSSGGLGGLPNDLNDLFQTPYDDDGARVHTNSWGSTLGDGSYNSNSLEVDEFVWDHRDCVICFSAGNEGVDLNTNGVIDPRSITPPGTAKNCITIGATENNRPNFSLTYQQGFGYPANPIASDRMADNPEGMVAFSSRGPTTDGRIKPDVVAPGSYILSTRSRHTSSSGWALSADPLYYFNGGTSMATPLVAGCAALVREYLSEEHQLPTPSAALVKAMLINGAQDVAGQYVASEAGGIPNNSEGFGRVDMAATLSDSVQLRDEATALDTGDEETTTITINDGASLKVTLVWTDRPGSTLQNDLDLVVRTASGQERHGNVAPNSTAFDRNNNVEQVLWENLPAGNVNIIVRAHRVPLFAQSYALVTRIEGGT